MIKNIAIPLLFVFLSLCVRAYGGGTVQREELIRRAFQSTGFILLTAGSDPAFMKSLSPAEIKTFYPLINTAHMANLRTWLKEQKLHNFGDANNEAFAYVMAAGNAGVKITFEIKADLIFSDDEKMFRLKPGEPERTAVTSSDLKGPIYIHRQLISRPDFKITFPTAIGLAVHEFGNKLGTQRDQAAIDSLAAKIQLYTELSTKTFDTPKGTLSLTTFKKPPFEGLLQSSVVPEPGSPPGTLSRLWLTGSQGLYAFLDNGRSNIDISEEMIKPLQRDSLKSPPRDMPYDWLKFYWYEGNAPKVTKISDSSLQIEMNMTKYFATIPFGKASSPEPTEFAPWNKLGKNVDIKSISHSRTTWNLDLSEDRPKFIQVKKLPQLMEDPSVAIELISSRGTSESHSLTYKVPSYYKIKGFLTGSAIQPILKIKFAGQILEIWGQPLAQNKEHFEFQIPRPSRPGDIEVIGMEATAANDPDMTAKDVVRLKFLLPKSEKITFDRNGSEKAPLELKSLQIWDGKKWHSLKRGSGPLTHGSHLRFIFDSTSKLISLDLMESYMNSTTIFAEAPPLPPLRYQSMDAVDDRTIHIPEEKLQQKLIGKKLFVDWQVDQDFILKSNFKGAIDPKAFLEMQKSLGQMIFTSMIPPQATQDITTEVVGPRRLSGIEAINGGLQNISIRFPTPLDFEKTSNTTRPLPLLNGKSCLALFH